MSSNMSISTRGSIFRRKFKKHMYLLLIQGMSFSNDNDTVKDKEVSLLYKHYVNNQEPNSLPEIKIDFCINGRTYRIAPSRLHGLGIFSMDGTNLPYKCEEEQMDYVGPMFD